MYTNLCDLPCDSSGRNVAVVLSILVQWILEQIQLRGAEQNAIVRVQVGLQVIEKKWAEYLENLTLASIWNMNRENQDTWLNYDVSCTLVHSSKLLPNVEGTKIWSISKSYKENVKWLQTHGLYKWMPINEHSGFVIALLHFHSLAIFAHHNVRVRVQDWRAHQNNIGFGACKKILEMQWNREVVCRVENSSVVY